MTELVTASQIAAKANYRSASVVNNWRKRYSDFPRPVRDDLYDWEEVEAWLKTHEARKAPIRPGVFRRSQTPWSVELLELARGELPPSMAVPVALTLTTIQALSKPGAILEPRVRALELEETKVPTRTFSTVFEAAHVRDQTLIRMNQLITQRLMLSAHPVDVFEELLSLHGQEISYASQTPVGIAKFLASLVPSKAKVILDPACGLGGILLAVTADRGSREAHGFEIEEISWALCVQRMLLHGKKVTVDWSDFFRSPVDQAAVDCVVVDPPVGVTPPEGSPEYRFLPSPGTFRNAGEFAWLLASRNALSGNGLAFVLSTSGTTFTGGTAQSLRHELVRSGSVVAVISLPPTTRPFRPNVVWVLRQPRPLAELSDVLFLNVTSDEDLMEASRHFRLWRTAPEKYGPVPGLSAVVPVLELLEGDVNIAPSRWTERRMDASRATEDARTAVQNFTHSYSTLRNAEPPSLALSPGAPEARLASLQDLAMSGSIERYRPPHVIKREDLTISGKYSYVTGVGVDGLREAGRLVDPPPDAIISQPGDVVLSTIEPIRAVVDREGGHVIGSSLWLIRSRTDQPSLDPDLLALLLSTPRIAGQAVGTTVRRLRSPKEVLIPLLDDETARSAARWARSLAATRKLTVDTLNAAEGAFQAVAAALDAGAAARPGRPPVSSIDDRLQSTKEKEL